MWDSPTRTPTGRPQRRRLIVCPGSDEGWCLEMRVGVPKESREGERRVALIPDSVGSLPDENLDVVVESGAGEASGHPDSRYSDVGATVGSDDDAWAADLVAKVALPSLEEIARLHSGQVLTV